MVVLIAAIPLEVTIAASVFSRAASFAASACMQSLDECGRGQTGAGQG